jgi:hypothetical protein
MDAVQGYRSAAKGVEEARRALRLAEGRGNAEEIAAARKALEGAEREKTASLLSGLGSVGMTAGDYYGGRKTPGLGEPQARAAAAGREAIFRAVSRGLSGAGDIVRRDWEGAAVSGLGMAAAVQGGLSRRPGATEGGTKQGGWIPAQSTLNDLSNMADAALSYRQAEKGLAAGNERVEEAERALRAARVSGDPELVRQAEANLREARRDREGALMGAIGTGDSLVQTAARIGQRRQEIAKVETVRRSSTERGEQLLEVLANPRASDRAKQEAARALWGIAVAGQAYENALASGDPQLIYAARSVLEGIQGTILRQQPGAIRVASAGVRDVEPTPAPASPEAAKRSAEGWASFWEGVWGGDFSENDSWSKTAGQVLVGLVPYLGQAADVRDTAAAIDGVRQGKEGAWIAMGTSPARASRTGSGTR